MFTLLELVLVTIFLLFFSIFLINRIEVTSSILSIKTKILLILVFLIYPFVFSIYVFSDNLSSTALLNQLFYNDMCASLQNKFLLNDLDFNPETLPMFGSSPGDYFSPLASTIFGAIDSISLLFVLMSHIVAFMVICFSSLYFDFENSNNFQNLRNFKFTLVMILFMTIMMDLLFLTDNLILIFFLAELSLFPLSFLMVKDTTIFWRKLDFESFYENKRPLAFYYLFFFTITSGGFGLIGLILVYFMFGSLSFLNLNDLTLLNLNYFFDILTNLNFYGQLSLTEFNSIVLCFSVCFLLFWIVVKVPLAPLHIWLPKAHVEGSTESSMVLAGIVLKITVYIFFKISCLPVFSLLLENYRPFLLSVAVTTAILGAFGSLLTTDMKRITAYSSVSHMGIIMAAGFYIPSSTIAVAPFIILLMAHTIISTAMFMFIGCIYKSRHGRFVSRNRLSYGGLLFLFPTFFLFGSIIFANLNIPLTLGFVGEFGVIVASIKSGLGLGIILLFASFILLLPMLAMLGQVLLGPVRLIDWLTLIIDKQFALKPIFYKKLVFNKIVWNTKFIDFYLLHRIYFFSIFLVILLFGCFIGVFTNFLTDFISINDLKFLSLLF